MNYIVYIAEFVSLLEHYTHDISRGAIASPDTAAISIAASVNRAALSHCIDCYVTTMSSLVLPTPDEQTLTKHHEHCVSDVQVVFKERIMIAEGSTSSALSEQLLVLIAMSS